MSNKVELLELDISTGNLLKKGAEAQKELERLKNESDFLKKTIKEGNITIEKYNEALAELEKQGKKNSIEYINLQKNADSFSKSQEKNREKLELVKNELGKQNQEYRNNQKAITDFNKAVETELGIITETDGSINQLNRALANNRKVYKELSQEQRENVAIGGELFKVISEQDKKYKDLQSSIGTTQVFVGDYKEQIKQALSESSGFSKQLDNQISQIPIVGDTLSKVVTVTRAYGKAKLASAMATNTSTKSLKFFRLALIGTGIGAFIVLLSSLVSYFSSTQKGIDAVNRVLTPLKIVFQSLFGVLQNVGEALVNTFSNPKKAMLDLYEFVKTNLINRFKAFGVILEGIINLDFKKISNGILQVGTGVEDVIGKTKNIANQTINFFDEAIKRGQRIEEIQQKLNKSEASFIENQGRLNKEFEEQKKKSDDVTKTFTERELAAKKAIELQEQISQSSIERINQEAEILRLKQMSNDTSDAEKADLAKKLVEIDKALQEEASKTTEAQNKLNSIRKEANAKAIELGKKRIDEALKESKTLLDIYIAEQGVKAKTLQEELIIAEEVAKRKKSILDAELKAKKISQSEYKLAILELDNDLISKRAELATDVAQRELQIFKDSHQQKLDANTFFSEELLKQEIKRLDEIAVKEREYHKKRLDQGIITQTEYNDAIKLVDDENRIAKDEAQILRDEAQKEKEIIDLENKRIIDEQEFQSQFKLQLSRLKQQYDAEIKSSEKSGADTTLITTKYTNAKKKIEDSARETKLNADGQAFGQIAEFIGKESAIGKAAALAQAGINIQLGITKALASKGFLGIVEGAIIAAKGAISIGKIAGVSTKFEKGGVVTIGGKRHSEGGTKFIGDDGTRFEAEKDEKMFILNRQASASLGPILSDINQKYGGASFSHVSTYLNDGGEVLRSSVGQNIKVDNSNIIDYDLLALKIGEANRQLPPPIVRPSEIIEVYNENQSVINGANR